MGFAGSNSVIMEPHELSIKLVESALAVTARDQMKDGVVGYRLVGGLRKSIFPNAKMPKGKGKEDWGEVAPRSLDLLRGVNGQLQKKAAELREMASPDKIKDYAQYKSLVVMLVNLWNAKASLRAFSSLKEVVSDPRVFRAFGGEDNRLLLVLYEAQEKLRKNPFYEQLQKTKYYKELSKHPDSSDFFDGSVSKR